MEQNIKHYATEELTNKQTELEEKIQIQSIKNAHINHSKQKMEK